MPTYLLVNPGAVCVLFAGGAQGGFSSNRRVGVAGDVSDDALELAAGGAQGGFCGSWVLAIADR